MGSNSFFLLAWFFCPLFLLAVNGQKRTLACDNVCKAIRFAGKIGGCNCNYIMFTKRSSEYERSLETEVEDLQQLRQNLNRNDDIDDNVAYENDDDSKVIQPKKLVNLLRRGIMNPLLRNDDY